MENRDAPGVDAVAVELAVVLGPRQAFAEAPERDLPRPFFLDAALEPGAETGAVGRVTPLAEAGPPLKP